MQQVRESKAWRLFKGFILISRHPTQAILSIKWLTKLIIDRVITVLRIYGCRFDTERCAILRWSGLQFSSSTYRYRKFSQTSLHTEYIRQPRSLLKQSKYNYYIPRFANPVFYFAWHWLLFGKIFTSKAKNVHLDTPKLSQKKCKTAKL